MDMATITAGYEGLKICKEIFGQFVDGRVDQASKEKIQIALSQLGNAQDAMFALREENFRLQNEVQELNKKLSETETWNKKASQYKLVVNQLGATVYEFIDQPKYWICPSCYNLKRIEPLQDLNQMSGHFECPNCQTKYPIKNPSYPPSREKKPYSPFNNF